MALQNIRLSQLPAFYLPLFGLEKEFRERTSKQVVALFMAKHAHEGWIDIFQFSVGIGEVDPFLQGLEQVLETSFAFAFRGDIARKNADTALGALADEGMSGALEISGGGFVL